MNWKSAALVFVGAEVGCERVGFLDVDWFLKSFSLPLSGGRSARSALRNVMGEEMKLEIGPTSKTGKTRYF